MSEENKPVGIKLKVAEAHIDDVNKGIARIDTMFLNKIGARPGEFVYIEGKRKTIALVDRAYPGDIGLNIIRMDGLTRRNAEANISENVKVYKADITEAKKIILGPHAQNMYIKAPKELFKMGLLGRGLMKGDFVSLGGARSRKTTMSASPFFNEVFNIEDSLLGFTLGDIKFIVANTDPKGKPVYVSENTEVVYDPKAKVEEMDQKFIGITYEDIGGLDDELKKIREMIELPLKHPELFETLGIEPPKGVILHGPPGTGKTLLAKAIATETNSNFISINGPEIVSKFYGESEANLRKKFENAEKNGPSIIFIDEIDAIAPKRDESEGEVEKRVVAQLLSLMDGLASRGKVIVIAATNRINNIDPALRRPGRFDREIEIGVPNKKGRLSILKIHTRNMPLSQDVNLDKLADVTHGFVGADISSLGKEAAMVVLRKAIPDLKIKDDESISKEFLNSLQITMDDFLEALKVVRPSAMREVLIEKPTVGFNDVGGLNEIKTEIREAIELPLKNGEVFKKLGIRKPKGILLYGPPGTGKTLLAKAVAKESEANFILVKGPELLSKWVGESEKAIRQVFQKARQTAPTIIFFDEIDSLFGKRSSSKSNDVSDKLVNQFLTEFDGLEELNDVVIIGSTNRPDLLDNAILRPGRFDRVLMVGAPDSQSRLGILRLHTEKMPLADDVNLEELNQKLDGCVGADIENICMEAGLFSIRRDPKAVSVSKEDFEKAIEKVGASTTKEILDSYNEFKKAFRRKTVIEKDTSQNYFV